MYVEKVEAFLASKKIFSYYNAKVNDRLSNLYFQLARFVSQVPILIIKICQLFYLYLL